MARCCWGNRKCVVIRCSNHHSVRAQRLAIFFALLTRCQSRYLFAAEHGRPKSDGFGHDARSRCGTSRCLDCSSGCRAVCDPARLPNLAAGCTALIESRSIFYRRIDGDALYARIRSNCSLSSSHISGSGCVGARLPSRRATSSIGLLPRAVLVLQLYSWANRTDRYDGTGASKG